jgi:16S rRNA (cytidine1402-2'-O)-methyltransferase
VATPIGNLGDITARAADILARCDVIACEDTRVTGKLLNHLESARRCAGMTITLRPRCASGLSEMAEKSVVLVSDAGTPLISIPAIGSCARRASGASRSPACRGRAQWSWR